MPYCERPGIRIYYEDHAPLDTASTRTCLLIPGLSANSQTFPYLVEFLRQSRRVVVFDPRGVGRTEPNRGRFGLSEVADDAAAILAELGIEVVDVIGISMGGMVAQELALAYPELVERLVLCCTWSGTPPGLGPYKLPIAQFVYGLVRQALTGDLETFADRHASMLLGPNTPSERRVAFFRHRKASTVMTPAGLISQIRAVRRFSSHERLAMLKVPTLILAGRDDRLVPVENARILWAAIEGAQIEILEGGHVFYYEDIERFRAVVSEFFG